MKPRAAYLLALALASAIALAACGGGEPATTRPASQVAAESESTEPTGPFPVALIGVADLPGFGPALVDSARKTLYRFSRDTRGSGESACGKACARIWRPVRSGGKPRTEQGAEESLAGTIERADGLIQATYDGWPLYTNIREYGERTARIGHSAFGGRWFALSPDGESLAP